MECDFFTRKIKERERSSILCKVLVTVPKSEKWTSLSGMFCFPNEGEFGPLSFHKVCVHMHLSKTNFTRKSYVDYWVWSRWWLYPWENECCPGGSNFLSVIDFAKVKLPRGNFYGYVKKKKRITNDSSRVKFYGLKNNQRSSTNHEKVECTKN